MTSHLQNHNSVSQEAELHHSRGAKSSSTMLLNTGAHEQNTHSLQASFQVRYHYYTEYSVVASKPLAAISPSCLHLYSERWRLTAQPRNRQLKIAKKLYGK